MKPRLLGEATVPTATRTAPVAAQARSRAPDVEPGEIVRLIARRRETSVVDEPDGADVTRLVARRRAALVTDVPLNPADPIDVRRLRGRRRTAAQTADPAGSDSEE